MEPQNLRVNTCSWCMVGRPRTAHPEYVSYSQLFASSSHVPYLRLQRLDNGEELCRGSRLRHYELTFTLT
jgi:hypothetical protein